MPETLVIRSHHGMTRPKRLGLLHLPEEIQHTIYEYLLIQRTSLWDKKHDLDCRNKDIPLDEFEIPPFIQNEMLSALPQAGGEQPSYKARVPCRCAKRKNLSLMRTCRTIREISAPIFWSNNIFCFREVGKFVSNLNALHPCYRQMIKEISVLVLESTKIPTLQAATNVKPNSSFWETLKKCTGLRRLEVPAEFIKPQGVDFAKHLNDLAWGMPELETVNFSYLTAYSDTSLHVMYPHPQKYRLTFLHSSYPGSLRPEWSPEDNVQGELIRTNDDEQQMFWTQGMVEELYHDLHLNFRFHVDTYVRLEIMNLHIWFLRRDIQTMYLPPDLHEHNSTRRVGLPTGKMTTLRFYGLPVSKFSRIEKAQKKMALDQQQKGINGLGHAQHAVNKKQEARKWRERAAEGEAESSQHQQVVEERVARRLENNKEDNKQVKKQEKKVKKKVRKSMRKEQDMKQKERKRVTP